jgi:hypothetical protein
VLRQLSQGLGNFPQELVKLSGRLGKFIFSSLLEITLPEGRQIVWDLGFVISHEFYTRQEGKPPSGEIPNSKSQIPNKVVPCGHIINASGDITSR